MSAPINSGGPAFPSPGIPSATDDRADQRDGMTLRDWFAGRAMQGIIGSHGFCSDLGRKDAAQTAYEIADAMIAQRSAATSLKDASNPQQL